MAKGFQLIPDDAIGEPLELSDVIASADQSEYIHYYVLPTLHFSEAGLYYRAVPWGTFSGREGYGLNSPQIFKDVSPSSLGTAGLKMELAATETDSAIFTDESGVETHKVPDNGIVIIAGYYEADTYYSPVAEVSTASGDIPPSGAGCNGGFGALIGLLAIAFTGSALHIRRKEN